MALHIWSQLMCTSSQKFTSELHHSLGFLLTLSPPFLATSIPSVICCFQVSYCSWCQFHIFSSGWVVVNGLKRFFCWIGSLGVERWRWERMKNTLSPPLISYLVWWTWYKNLDDGYHRRKPIYFLAFLPISFSVWMSWIMSNQCKDWIHALFNGYGST